MRIETSLAGNISVRQLEALLFMTTWRTIIYTEKKTGSRQNNFTAKQNQLEAIQNTHGKTQSVHGKTKSVRGKTPNSSVSTITRALSALFQV